MSLDLFKDAVHQGVAIGMLSIDLCGFGDVFMDPGLEEKLRWAKETYPYLKIYVSTTGDLLTEKRLPAILDLVTTLKFSHYAFSAETYAEVHGGAVKYERARENILRVLALPPEKRPYVMVSFLLLDKNAHELEAWKEFWEPRADEISVWRQHNYGGTYDHGHSAVAAAKSETAKTCNRPLKGNPFVRTNGDVSVCCFDFDHRLVVGNITTASLLDVLQGEEMRRVQDIHTAAAFSGCGLRCEQCDQIYDRSDALVYSNSSYGRRVGFITSHPDPNLINDLTTSAPVAAARGASV
jgi:hypothetical protein